MWSKLLARKIEAQPGPLPLRETTKTGWLSQYRLFWLGCKWQPIFFPGGNGYSTARLDLRTLAKTKALLDEPGVYELALMKGNESSRYKVFVGYTHSMKRRFKGYRTARIRELQIFFDEALKTGNKIYMRCHYTEACEEVAHFLSQYDYAWNAKQVGCQARHVNVMLPDDCCYGCTPYLVHKPAVPTSKRVPKHVQRTRTSQNVSNPGTPVSATAPREN